jgi:hypothetical protein
MCAQILMALVNKVIPTSVFEENWPVDKSDAAIDAIYLQIDTCYSDDVTYLSYADLAYSLRRMIVLCLAFLAHQNEAYQWPAFPESMPSGMRRILLFRSSMARIDAQWAAWRESGNPKYWPFLYRTQACQALHGMRYRLLRKCSKLR